MKKQQPADPQTYAQQKLDNENRRHAARHAELNVAAKKLEMFEPTFQSLAARGVTVSLEFSGLRGFMPAVLHVCAGIFSDSHLQLYDALIALGYKEDSRREHSTYAAVELKQGRLTLSLTIPPGHGAPAKDAAAPVQTSAPAEA